MLSGFGNALPPRRILYTEDDADTRELVTFILAGQGYKLVAIANHNEAVALARESRFDLYLLDSCLSGGSGFDLCRAIREFDGATPILFYSGAATPEDKSQAIASGAQGYLVKPVNPNELIAEVFRLVGGSRRVQEEPSAV